MLEIIFAISIVVVAILFAVYYKDCAANISAVNAELKNLIRWLGKPREFKDIDASFKNHKRLAPIWADFKKTLVAEKYSTTNAAEFFNMTNLTVGMNMTFWQGYGGIFTGLGILGTFAGLTLGLYGVDMTSDIKTLKGSIAQLLSGVNTAFITSLVGIGAALFYSVAHHRLLVKFQENIQLLASKLDENFPRRSAEHWLVRNYAEAQTQSATLQSIDTEVKEQTTVLKNIGEDVARAIYDGLDERMNAAVENLCSKLEEKLLPQVDRICAAIDKLGSGGNEVIGDIFSKQVGSQMDRFSAALDRFSDSIDKKLEAANEISKIMNEQLLNTLKALDESLKQQAQASAKERDAAFEQFMSTLVGLSNTLQEVADKIKTQQETSANNFASLLKNALDNFNAVMAQVLENVQTKFDNANKQNNVASENFLSTLAGLSNTLQEVADKIKTQQETSADNFASLLKNALDNFNAVMAQVLENVQTKFDNANKQNNVASENFLSTLAGLSNTLQEVADKIKTQQAGHLDNFDSLIKNLIGQLEEFTRQQKSILNVSANNHAAQINEAVKAFRAIVDAHNRTTQETFNKIQALLSKTETFLELLNDANISLKQAADPVKQSALQLSRNLTDTAAQMKTLATANQTTRDNLAALSTRLAEFVRNFNGIADELERSTTTITNSLDNYNVKTNAGLTAKLEAFDKSMAGAVGHLKTLLEDLSDALDDFKRNRRG